MSPPRQVHVCGMSGVAVLGGLKKVRVLDLCHNRGSETEQMMGGLHVSSVTCLYLP